MMERDRATVADWQPRTSELLVMLILAAFALLAFACGEVSSEDQSDAGVPSPQSLVAAVSAASPSAPTPRSAEQTTEESVTPTSVPMPTPAVSSSSQDRERALPEWQVQDKRVHIVPERDLSELAARLRGAEVGGDTPESAEPMSAGDRRDFWLTDLDDGSARVISATLMVVSENAYWFVDDAMAVEQAAMEEAARLFEERARPVVVAAFGDIRNPGIDGDPRLIALHARLDGAAGYYGGKDAYSTEVHPHSNEGEIIYIDAEIIEPGTDLYMSVLVHEFQHAIHFNQDMGEDTWVNEGLSELATEVAGYEASFPRTFLRSPDTQLNYWPESQQARLAHYGASALFFRYMAQRIGGTESLIDLMTERQDGIAGVDAFLRRQGLRFEDVFADWVVANYLDAEDERYGYADSEVRVGKVIPLGDGTGRERALPQFSAGYYALRSDAAEGVLRFEGSGEVRQVEAACVSDGGCWWSGRGDAINTRLTREFDLTGLDAATLEYMVWHDIEEGWDYGYVEVSDDGGRTWHILEGEYTWADDVSGNAYGPGYTGRSRTWKRESIDLTRFVGGPVLARFEYVTDDAIYRDGFMVAEVSVPQIDDDMDEGEWVAEGFTPATESLRQRFVVQVVTTSGDGGYEVSRLELDGDNSGEMTLSGLDAPGKDVVIVVSPTTRDTRHEGRYTLEFVPG